MTFEIILMREAPQTSCLLSCGRLAVIETTNFRCQEMS